MQPQAPTTTASLLRSSLRDPRTREVAITNFVQWLFFGLAVVGLLVLPLVGWKLSVAIALVLGLGGLGYGAQVKWMKRGGFHPALQWLNVTVEVSTPAALYVADSFTQGPVYALTAPPLAFWGAVIMLSGLRAKKSLAIYAGALAAVEYAALYALLSYPALPADAPVTLQPPMVAVRCILLFLSGLLTALVTSQFIKHAEAAFKEVREKELSGKYLLHERIGSGGMAEVFRATYSPEGGFEKLVAVKRVLPAYAEDTGFVQMFRREAEVCSRLSHPNIVQVFDLGRDRGTYFLAMEYVDGISLQTLIRALPQPLPVAAVAWLGVELAAALDYLHKRTDAEGHPLKLVHRDVNPPNVLISRAGDVKLSDFGIARAADAVTLTSAGVVRGKAGYMPPEQIYNEPLDGRADLYALGLTLYEALSGKRAFVAEDTDATLTKSLETDLPRPSTLRKDVPPELDNIIMQLLEKDLPKRTPSGQVLRAQLLELPEIASPLKGQTMLAQATRIAVDRMDGSTKPHSAEAVTVESRAMPDQIGRQAAGG